MLAISAPFPQFFDTDGTPLSNGSLYFGAANANPEVSPLPVFWDLAGTQPAAQPLKTLNGVIVRSGTPAQAYLSTDYSLTVRNAKGVVCFYAATSLAYGVATQAAGQVEADFANTSDPTKGSGLVFSNLALTYAAGSVGYDLQQRIPVVSTIAALKATSKLVTGRMMVTGYYAALDGGGGLYVYDSTDTTSADNGGTIIVGTDGGRWKLVYSGKVSLKQFGCKGDNVNDSTALQNACTWAFTSPQHALYAPSGTYVSTGISLTYVDGSGPPAIGLNIEGEGFYVTVIKFTTAAGLLIHGAAGSIVNTVISGVQFVGISTTVLVECESLCGQKFRYCQFNTGAVGLRFHNKLAGGFTEYSVADTCDFTTTCTVKLHFKVTSGTNSFNGCGLIGQCTINSTAAGGDVIVQIDNGCLLYNCPFYAHIWGNGNCTVFNNANTSLLTNFYGQITLERFAGTITLGAATVGLEVAFAGKLNSLNENFTWGAFFLCDWYSGTSAGNRQLGGARYGKLQAMTTGANTVIGFPAGMVSGLVKYSVALFGTGYAYRYEVSTFNNNAGSGAPVSVSFAAVNTAGYGAPTFTIDSNQRLVITNGSFPTSGVTARIDGYQIGQSYDAAFIG